MTAYACAVCMFPAGESGHHTVSADVMQLLMREAGT